MDFIYMVVKYHETNSQLQPDFCLLNTNIGVQLSGLHICSPGQFRDLMPVTSGTLSIAVAPPAGTCTSVLTCSTHNTKQYSEEQVEHRKLFWLAEEEAPDSSRQNSHPEFRRHTDGGGGDAYRWSLTCLKEMGRIILRWEWGQPCFFPNSWSGTVVSICVRGS